MTSASPASPASSIGPGPAAEPRVRVRASIYAMEWGLQRRGFAYVAGVDEAGRGACAGPLVVAAAILPEGKRGQVPGLADSKLLTAAAREQVYAQILRRAFCWHAVVIPPGVIDRRGLHVCNVEGMRRAVAGLAQPASYVLTDGFAVPGLGAPSLAVWKGDRVSACVAAASVVAKVTRDRIMVALHEQYPQYEFSRHKGYVTPEHGAALRLHGPCPEHRFSYVNVAAAAGLPTQGLTEVEEAALDVRAEETGEEAFGTSVGNNELMTGADEGTPMIASLG
jgi:ribonuclease HII